VKFGQDKFDMSIIKERQRTIFKGRVQNPMILTSRLLLLLAMDVIGRTVWNKLTVINY